MADAGRRAAGNGPMMSVSLMVGSFALLHVIYLPRIFKCLKMWCEIIGE